MSNKTNEGYLMLPTGHRVDFNIGQIVYLKTDNEQHERIVTGIGLRPNKSVTYCLSFCTMESWHYAVEINGEKDVLKLTNA